jgi:hypothetical protein
MQSSGGCTSSVGNASYQAAHAILMANKRRWPCCSVYQIKAPRTIASGKQPQSVFKTLQKLLETRKVQDRHEEEQKRHSTYTSPRYPTKFTSAFVYNSSGKRYSLCGTKLLLGQDIATSKWEDDDSEPSGSIRQD